MTTEELNQTLLAILEKFGDFSDVFFLAGSPVQVEVFGSLLPYPDESASSEVRAEEIAQLVTQLVGDSERLKEDLDKLGACDCSYLVDERWRFRTNIFRQDGRLGIVMRRLNPTVPTLPELRLPPIFKSIVQEKAGLIFVTGPTGSGKTSTLAAMMNELNRTSRLHIVTLEDPIEFKHVREKAVFSQRELGRDFPSFAVGLRSALRQAPKVIMIGEIRDRETMEVALMAGETGHAVYATLHTSGVSQSVNRILGFFSRDEEQLIRRRLANTLRYVVSQLLVPSMSGGKALVSEIMGVNLRAREAILLGEEDGRFFSEIIASSAHNGWRTLDMSLVEAYGRNVVSEEVALMFATSKGKVSREIDVIKQKAGETGAEEAPFKLETPPLAEAEGLG